MFCRKQIPYQNGCQCYHVHSQENILTRISHAEWENITQPLIIHIQGKSLSEALILGSTKPQWDKRLFDDENYKLRTCCMHKLFFVLTFKK